MRVSQPWNPAACAALLSEARRAARSIDTLPSELAPPSETDAYEVQQLILAAEHDTIGGWKAGAKGADAPINGGLLPSSGIHPSGTALALSDFPWVGLELEIAFQLNRDFPAQSAPYSDVEVMESIAFMLPTIELVTSRIKPNPDNPRRWAVADLLNHGALIVGNAVPYDPAYPFLSPDLRWTFNGANIAPAGPATNPAGDPRRLLTWTVNHCCQQGWDFRKEMLITAGTFTGVFKPTQGGEAVGHFADLGDISLTLR